MEKLKPGDRYLSIVVLGSIKLAAFKNKDKKPGQPDYKGEGIAIWVNTKRAEGAEVEKQDVI